MKEAKANNIPEISGPVFQRYSSPRDQATRDTRTSTRDATGKIIGSVRLPTFWSPSTSLKSCKRKCVGKGIGNGEVMIGIPVCGL